AQAPAATGQTQSRSTEADDAHEATPSSQSPEVRPDAAQPQIADASKSSSSAPPTYPAPSCSARASNRRISLSISRSWRINCARYAGGTPASISSAAFFLSATNSERSSRSVASAIVFGCSTTGAFSSGATARSGALRLLATDAPPVPALPTFFGGERFC